MKKLNNVIIKYLAIAIVVIAGYSIMTDVIIVLRLNIFGAPAIFQMTFINDLALIIVGVLGIRYYNDFNKSPLLAKISGVQTVVCLLFVCLVHIPKKLIYDATWFEVVYVLSVPLSVIMLIYYMAGAKKHTDK